MSKRVVWVGIFAAIACGGAEGPSIEEHTAELAPPPTPEAPSSAETPSDDESDTSDTDPSASAEPAPLQPAECIPAGAFACGPTTPTASCTPMRFSVGLHDVRLTLEETNAYAFTTDGSSGIIDTRQCTELASSRAAQLEVVSSGGTLLHFDAESNCEVIGVCKNRSARAEE